MSESYGKGGFFRRHRIFLLFQLLVLLLIAALLLIQLHMTTALSGQEAAKRWQNTDGTPSAQLSVFFTDDAALSTTAIYSLREKLDAALLENSLTASNENARLWYDAYSAETDAVLTSERGSVEAVVTVVGGDFFLLHDLPLVSGCYFTESTLNTDRILLDTQAAWQLFGSSDVAGMQVTLDGKPCLIVGVVEASTDRWTDAAYGDTPRVYRELNPYAEETPPITCYEVVLPNPVDGFARGLLEAEFPSDEDSHILVENSARFSFVTLWKLLLSFAESRMVTSCVAYPFWENAARVLEAQTALVQAAWCVLCLFPFIGLVMLCVTLWKHRRFHFADIPAYYEAFTERLRERRKNRRARHRQSPGQSPNSLD